MSTLYIDVSQHDRNRRGKALDWAAIAASTGQGTVMAARASYGDPATFNPPTNYWLEFQRGAAAAGYTCRGGYHNVIHGDQASINRQVDLLRSQLDAGGAVWALADVEKYPELIANGLWPRWDDVRRFHDRWYAVEGRVMAWYLAEWVWDGQLNNPDLTYLKGPLSNAHYDGGTGTPAGVYVAAGGDHARGWGAYGGRVPDLLQYTSSGVVAGAGVNTDCDAYRGTLAELVALLTNSSTGGDDMPITPAEIALIANASADRVWHSDVDSGDRNISAGTALLGVYDRKVSPVDVAALAAAVATALAADQTFLTSLATAVNDDAAARLAK